VELADPRFGVVVTGPLLSARTEAIGGALRALGAGAWYCYARCADFVPGQVEMVRPGADFAEVAARASSRRGRAWLLGNEPNVPGQDDLDPSAYADFVAQVAATIRGADPTAVLVGPNVLNWETTCTACPGFASGRLWSEAFVRAYVARYGPLPLNAWGVHTYNLDWLHLPLVNVEQDLAELAAVKAWLDSEGLPHPIWLTEFGVMWGFDGIEWIPQPDGGYVAEPRGAFGSDVTADYLHRMLVWLTETGASAGIERWFLYATTPPAEPYASVPTGLALLDPESLAPTELGAIFRAWAVRNEE
jgi:hypothetical protein